MFLFIVATLKAMDREMLTQTLQSLFDEKAMMLEYDEFQ
jgi:hypothetical protein